MVLRLSTPLRTWSAHRELRAQRRSADEQLLASRLPSPRLAWRIAELVAAEHRVEVGRSVADAVRAADERRLPGARPINRAAVRETRAQLLDVASHLFDRGRPVSPRGMLLLEKLLADGTGPLYGSEPPRKLRLELEHIREALGA